MATYVYETIPRLADGTPQRFEFQQSMKDAPLTHHPDTGEAVRRVISGGYGIMGAGGNDRPASSPAPCAAGCACHSGPRFPQP